jgi:hypothetical protein
VDNNVPLNITIQYNHEVEPGNRSNRRNWTGRMVQKQSGQ